MESINFRIDENDKIQLTELMKSLGLNLSTYFNMATKKALEVGGIPFDVVVSKPNKRLQSALDESEKIISGDIPVKRYNSLSEAAEDLD